jgi:hypothetical protein
MTLAEAIETTRIARVTGLTGDRIALVTARRDRSSLWSSIAMRTGNGSYDFAIRGWRGDYHPCMSTISSSVGTSLRAWEDLLLNVPGVSQGRKTKGLPWLQALDFLGGAEGGRTPDLMTANNAVLTEAVAAGRFRADLYHRLAVVVLTLPAGGEPGYCALSYATLWDCPPTPGGGWRAQYQSGCGDREIRPFPRACLATHACGSPGP